MNYDYKYGNNYYKYNGKKVIRSTVYNILASEQSQDVQPGMEYLMNPLPIFDNYNYYGSNKLKDKVIIITGGDSAMARGAMPYELAPTFVYLASDDSSDMTGQVIHVNGGEVMG